MTTFLNRFKIYHYALFFLSIMFLGTFVFAGQEEIVVLTSDDWTVRIYPKSLQVLGELKGKNRIQISAPQANLGTIENLKQSKDRVSWELPREKISLTFQLKGEELSVYFRSQQTSSFTWPIINNEKSIRGYILPLFEGSYAPVDDAEWIGFLIAQSPMNTTEGLSMPFWGLDCGDCTLTYILTNQFNNKIAFENRESRLAMRFTHEFTRNWKRNEYGILIRLGAHSPV